MHKCMNVVVLQVFLKRDAEYCLKELDTVKRHIGREIFPAMHDKRHLAIVILTHETPRALVERLRPSLDQDAITNYWAIIPSRNIASKFGNLDSLTIRVAMAYAITLQRSKPQNVIEVQTRRRKNLSKDASVEVGVKASRSGKNSKYPDR